MLKHMFQSGSFRFAISFVNAVLFLQGLLYAGASASPQFVKQSDLKSKVGEVRSLPNLQTRARPPLLPKSLHLGMKELQFFDYAQSNNWASIESIHRGNNVVHRLQPGGEGLYALPNLKLVYARGFTANVYFENGRLVGMHLVNDPRDRSLTATQLITLVRAWFPDHVIEVIYQVVPTDPQQRVVETLIGKLPEDFSREIGQTKLPFCRVVLFPAPLPINSALSSCLQSS